MNHLGTTTLETERLLLRKIEESDAEELYAGFVNQEAFLYYAHKSPRTLEEEQRSLCGIADKYQDPAYYNWVITLKDGGKIIGSIYLRVYDANDSVEFNYAIDDRYVNRDYMTEALSAVRDYCFQKIGVHRFQGGCCVENRASQRVMEKCGMELEGTLKDYIRLRDGFHHMHMFSLINSR